MKLLQFSSLGTETCDRTDGQNFKKKHHLMAAYISHNVKATHFLKKFLMLHFNCDCSMFYKLLEEKLP